MNSTRLLRHLNYSNVMATIGVFIALGGASYAAVSLPAKSVGTKQLKTGAVAAAKLKANAVTSAKVRDGSLAAADFKPGELPAGSPGPAGPEGPKGDPGAQGPAGSARAYGTIKHFGPEIVAARSTTNVTAAERLGKGLYCVTVAGIDPDTTSPVASVDWSATTGPEGSTSAMFVRATGITGCSGQGKFLFATERHENVAVDQNNVPNSAVAVAPADFADNVSFQFIIP